MLCTRILPRVQRLQRQRLLVLLHVQNYRWLHSVGLLHAHTNRQGVKVQMIGRDLARMTEPAPVPNDPRLPDACIPCDS